MTQENDEEHQVRNVFDEFAHDGDTVPVNMDVNGKKTTVGQAHVWAGDDGYIHAEMTLANDDVEEVKNLFSHGIQAYSLDEIAPDISEAEAQALFEFPPHKHLPTDHQDGQEPWCDICGLNVRLEAPIERVRGRHARNVPDNFGFGKPSRLFGD